MSEMVERVAKAIYEAKTGDEFVGAGAGPEHDLAFEMARAALGAMRDLPRDTIAAMEIAVDDAIDSATDTNGAYDVWDANTVANAVHRAMIDTAIAE